MFDLMRTGTHRDRAAAHGGRALVRETAADNLAVERDNHIIEPWVVEEHRQEPGCHLGRRKVTGKIVPICDRLVLANAPARPRIGPRPRDEAQWPFTRLPLCNGRFRTLREHIRNRRSRIHHLSGAPTTITSCVRRPHPWAGTGCRGTCPNTCAHSLAARQSSRMPSVAPHPPAAGPSGRN